MICCTYVSVFDSVLRPQRRGAPHVAAAPPVPFLMLLVHVVKLAAVGKRSRTRYTGSIDNVKKESLKRAAMAGRPEPQTRNRSCLRPLILSGGVRRTGCSLVSENERWEGGKGLASPAGTTTAAEEAERWLEPSPNKIMHLSLSLMASIV